MAERVGDARWQLWRVVIRLRSVQVFYLQDRLQLLSGYAPCISETGEPYRPRHVMADRGLQQQVIPIYQPSNLELPALPLGRGLTGKMHALLLYTQPGRSYGRPNLTRRRQYAVYILSLFVTSPIAECVLL